MDPIFFLKVDNVDLAYIVEYPNFVAILNSCFVYISGYLANFAMSRAPALFRSCQKPKHCFSANFEHECTNHALETGNLMSKDVKNIIKHCHLDIKLLSEQKYFSFMLS